MRGRPTSVFRSILIIIANADYANYPFEGLFVSSSTDMRLSKGVDKGETSGNICDVNLKLVLI